MLKDHHGVRASTTAQKAGEMVVKKSQTAQGHAGEHLHVRGPHMEMRLWENVPYGYHFAPHDCAVDIAGFIIKGSGLWRIDGQEYLTSAGDSYYLPAGSMYGLTVLEELSAVEVLSPPLRDNAETTLEHPET
jgi:quercetin dioxygenase-like cupin family protein